MQLTQLQQYAMMDVIWFMRVIVVILNSIRFSVVLVAIALFVGCEEGPGTSVTTHELNPPSWIIGTWGSCNSVSSPGFEFYWRFSEHNVVLRAGNTSTDYAEALKGYIEESHGNNWYRFDIEVGNQHTWNRFTKNGSRLDWTGYQNGISTDSTLCQES